MATKIIFDKKQRTAFIKRTGRIMPGEMMQGTKELESNPLFQGVTKSLSDVSAGDFSEISADEFEFHAQYCGEELKDLRIAIIAPSELSYGLARRFEILAEKENLLVTREMEKALAWLEVTLPEDF